MQWMANIYNYNSSFFPALQELEIVYSFQLLWFNKIEIYKNKNKISKSRR